MKQSRTTLQLNGLERDSHALTIAAAAGNPGIRMFM